MGLTDDFNRLLEMKKRVVEEVATEMLSEFISVTPVITGQLKGAWDIEEIEDGWRISNNMIYADVIFEGRGDNYNLPDGLLPIIKKYNILLEDRLNKIKV